MREVKATRLKLGMTQAQFADVLGVSKRTVEGWEAGASAPKYLVYALAYLLQQTRTGKS